MSDFDRFEEFISKLSKDEKDKVAKWLSSDKDQKPKWNKSKPKNVVNEDFTVQRDNKKVRKPVRFSKNTWNDDGEDLDMKTPPIKGGKRQRRSGESSRKIEVECCACGRDFLEYEELVYGEFLKCPSCIQRSV